MRIKQGFVTIIKCIKWLFDRDAEYFASVFCTGDTLILGGLLAAYKEQHPEKRKIVIIRSSHRQIIDFYQDGIDEVVEIGAGQVMIVKIWFYWCSVFSRHMHYCLSERTLFKRDPDAVPRLASLGLLHCYKKTFLLKPNSVFKRPEYSNNGLEIYKRILTDYRIKEGKMVLLAPYTVTLKKFNYIPFFEHLAGKLIEMGYSVFTNTVDDRCIKNTIPLKTSFGEITALGRIRGVISVRSGLCDMLEFSECKLTVIYPTKTDYQIFSLNRMFGKRDRINEIIVFPESRNINRIINDEGEEMY